MFLSESSRVSAGRLGRITLQTLLGFYKLLTGEVGLRGNLSACSAVVERESLQKVRSQGRNKGIILLQVTKIPEVVKLTQHMIVNC